MNNKFDAEKRPCLRLDEACTVMKGKCISPTDVASGFSRVPRDASRFDACMVPYSKELLEEVSTDHILVWGMPLSIADMVKTAPLDAIYSHDGIWYLSEHFSFANRVRRGWFLIRSGPIPFSTNKPLSEQLSMLADNEDVPAASELLYALLFHYLKSGERLCDTVYCRCKDVDSRGEPVSVGSFNKYGIKIYPFRDTADRSIELGITSIRKA